MSLSTCDGTPVNWWKSQAKVIKINLMTLWRYYWTRLREVGGFSAARAQNSVLNIDDAETYTIKILKTAVKLIIIRVCVNESFI